MVDTNIFVYAHDPTDPTKQAKAVTLIEHLSQRGELVTSVQVLNELYVALTRPNKAPSLSRDEAREIVRSIAEACKAVLALTKSVSIQAMDATSRHGMHFWDAVLWATARENDISLIHTEDTPSAPEIDGVRYVNPFAGGA